MEKLKPGKNNKEDRMNFVEFWARFVRTHSDEEWGEQQNKLINSMMHSGKHYPFTAKEYLELKGEKFVY